LAPSAARTDGVQPALEQGAEDAGVDRAPVHRRGGLERRHVGRVQRRHGDGLEQPAVEPGQVVHAEQAAVAHGLEQAGELAAQPLGRDHHTHQPLEQPLGQQPHVLGKEAEQALRQEVAHLLGRHPGRAQPRRGAGKGLRRRFGDVAVAAPRAPGVRLGPQCAQALAQLRIGQVGQRKHVALTGRAGEVRVHLDAQPVAHHQQRRVLQRQGVEHQLLQRLLQAAPGPLVLPGEVPAQPDVGKAIGARRCAAGLDQPALEAIVLRIRRLRHAEQAAEVDEMRLRAGPLIELVRGAAGAPLADEVGGGHVARLPCGLCCCRGAGDFTTGPGWGRGLGSGATFLACLPDLLVGDERRLGPSGHDAVAGVASALLDVFAAAGDGLAHQCSDDGIPVLRREGRDEGLFDVVGDDGRSWWPWCSRKKGRHPSGRVG
jgi:hypothetical protein